MRSNRLTLHIEPRPEGDGIAGQVCDGIGEERHFTGWLGLLSLLEEARQAVVAERAIDPGATGERAE